MAAKKKTTTAKKPRAIDLFKEIIPAIDQGGSDIWDLLTDEQRKEIEKDFWILNRYISSVAAPTQRWQKGPVPTREEQEHYVEIVNEVYNKNWATVQKQPKLMWQLLCMCGHESKKEFHHEYIPLKKEKNKKVMFLLDLFPTMKKADVETLAAINDERDIKKYCEKLGWDKKAIDAIKL